MNNFNRNNIDHYLYQIAKNYKKQNKSGIPLEIIIVGGASIMLNYNFRNTTTDIDALIQSYSSIKEIINKVGDENNLDVGWINQDFKNTTSYSDKLYQYSNYYKTFCDCISVRLVKDEYLIAMKMMSNRTYKKDISDIIGIIKENKEKGTPITQEKIYKAINNLYGDINKIPKTTLERVNNIFQYDDLEDLYYTIIEEESSNRQKLINIEKENPNKLNEKNIDAYLKKFSIDISQNQIDVLEEKDDI